MHAIWFFPCKQNLRRRTCVHCEHCSDWNCVAKSGHAFGGCNAHTLITLTTVKLRAFAGGIAQCVEGRGSGRKKFVFASCCCKFGDASTKNEAAIHVTSDEAVVFESAGQSMGGRASEAGCCN
jgi:hypothetical protein